MATKYNHWLIAAVIFLLLSAIFHFSSANIPDLDSFYYLRLATTYKTQGLFNPEFPWLPHTTITTFSSSLWYGFSIILIPFSYLNGIIGIKLAGLLLTTIALLIFYLVMRQHEIKWPLLWPIFLFFSAPNVLTQFLMTRPQIISLILAPLLFSLLISGGFWNIFLITFGISWVHLNFAWIPIVVFATIAASKFFIEKRLIWKESLAVILGILLGWLLRPNAIGAAKLFYIQVLQQILEKQSGLPLLFGAENYPLSSSILFKNFLPFLIIWIAAIIFFILKNKLAALVTFTSQQKIIITSSGALSLIFFLLTMFVARRGYNLWAEFGIIFIATIFSYIISKTHGQNIAKTAIGIALIFSLFSSSYKSAGALKNSYAPDTLKEVGLWLKTNSARGDIVLNLHWPDFSPLFFWNQTNYYAGGLDPIFQYSYNPSLYWKFHYLATDQVTSKTCGAEACTQSMLEDTYEVLRKDFHAKYIILVKAENPAVYYFLKNDPRFEEKLDTKREVVYLIK